MITKLRERSQITLPIEIIRKLKLKTGDNLEIAVENEQIIIKPVLIIERSQAWFWSKEWQEKEKEVDEDIEAGRIVKASNIEELFESLES